MKRYQLFSLFTLLTALLTISCADNKQRRPDFDELRTQLHQIIDNKPGRFGIALITDQADTLTLNNSADYPLMSVFKLHESLAVCHTLEKQGHSLDSMLTISKQEINPDTWSPMLKDYDQEGFDVSIRTLLDYLITQSDNNASNILFDRIVNVATTDSIIATLLPERSFKLVYKESEMSWAHLLAHSNVSSPLSCAMLVDKLFTDSLISPSNQEYIKQTMAGCQTGLARIAAGLPTDKGIKFAHRTGSGYTNITGEIAAINDVAYITLPNRRSYTLAILVKDYKGSQEDAEAVMADISKTIYQYISASYNDQQDNP